MLTGHQSYGSHKGTWCLQHDKEVTEEDLWSFSGTVLVSVSSSGVQTALQRFASATG